MAQHALACMVERGAVASEMVLQVAEGIHAPDWTPRRLDVAAETEQVHAGLAPAQRSPEGIQAGLAQAAEALEREAVLSTWFEDGPQVHAALKALPRNDPDRLARTVLAEVLPDKRDIWAERFLLMALWCQATSEAKYRRLAQGMAATAQALISGTALEDIPAMRGIAEQTVTSALQGIW
jgi:hypothetical protein